MPQQKTFVLMNEHETSVLNCVLKPPTKNKINGTVHITLKSKDKLNFNVHLAGSLSLNNKIELEIWQVHSFDENTIEDNVFCIPLLKQILTYPIIFKAKTLNLDTIPTTTQIKSYICERLKSDQFYSNKDVDVQSDAETCSDVEDIGDHDDDDDEDDDLDIDLDIEEEEEEDEEEEDEDDLEEEDDEDDLDEIDDVDSTAIKDE